MVGMLNMLIEDGIVYVQMLGVLVVPQWTLR